MKSYQASQMRRRSMVGTALLALAVIAAVAFAMTSTFWLIGAAVIFLVPGVMMFYQVGISPPLHRRVQPGIDTVD